MRFDLRQVTFIMPGNLLELVPQGTHPDFAMNEFQVPRSSRSEHAPDGQPPPNSGEDPLRNTEWSAAIVQTRGPGVLIEGPDYLPVLTDDSANPVVEHRLDIREVMQNEAHEPLAGCVPRLKIRFRKIKERERSIPRNFVER